MGIELRVSLLIQQENPRGITACWGFSLYNSLCGAMKHIEKNTQLPFGSQVPSVLHRIVSVVSSCVELYTFRKIHANFLPIVMCTSLFCGIVLVMESNFDEENDIEETLEPQAHGGSLKREKKMPDATGLSMYGDTFTGYQKIEEYRDLIPAYKEFYYQRKIADPNLPGTRIIRMFNEEVCAPLGRRFHPYTKNVSNWKQKWDKDLMQQRGMIDHVITPKKTVQQVLKTREGDENLPTYGAPTYDSLEQGVQTLGGELMNDALQMLRDDQALEDIYESDELIKRKMYVVNVFGHVTKMVHGKATLMLKASQEKRENAGFLMELLGKASAGKMSLEEINALRHAYQPTNAEAAQPHVSRV